jgi:acetolactate decarboxylase
MVFTSGWLNPSLVLASLFGVLSSGCVPDPSAKPGGRREAEHARSAAAMLDDSLVQFSVIAALATGDYSDGASLRSVVAQGDFGIGTFNRLDGEMILLDGKMYQALADGTTRAANLDDSTPFAAVTTFKEDGRIEKLTVESLEDLDARLDQDLPRPNSPYAIRIDGEFAELTMRSVPAQSPPFRPLVEVVKTQPTWTHKKVRGTLVGLRCPAWIGTLNVSGYHWHFLSDDRAIGGHLLGCRFNDALLRYDECQSVLIQIPQSKRFDEFNKDQIREQDINRIERQRDEGDKR